MTVIRDEGIRESRKLNAIPWRAHTLYPHLLSCADDWGRLRVSPTILHGQAWPRREVTAESIEDLRAALAAYVSVGLMRTWEVDGVTFGEWTGWQARPAPKVHKTPEPPWSEHTHTGWCAPSAIRQAKLWSTGADLDAALARIPCVNRPRESGRFAARVESTTYHRERDRESNRESHRAPFAPFSNPPLPPQGGEVHEAKACGAPAPPYPPEPARPPAGGGVIDHDPTDPLQADLVALVVRYAEADAAATGTAPDYDAALYAATVTPAGAHLTRLRGASRPWLEASVDQARRMLEDLDAA